MKLPRSVSTSTPSEADQDLVSISFSQPTTQPKTKQKRARDFKHFKTSEELFYGSVKYYFRAMSRLLEELLHTICQSFYFLNHDYLE